jgi:methylase of polypeptide subunit release factors
MLGYQLSVPPTVFHPGFYFTSKILAERLRRIDLSGKHVLDAGCGSGILALAAASSGARVTALDINPAAAAATNLNARRNGFGDRIQAIVVDINSGVPDAIGSVDMIVVNPPYYQDAPRTLADRAFKGGASNEFVEMLAEASSRILAPDGSIILILSSDVDEATVLQPFASRFFRRTTLCETRRLFERLTVFQLEKTGHTSSDVWNFPK